MPGCMVGFDGIAVMQIDDCPNKGTLTLNGSEENTICRYHAEKLAAAVALLLGIKPARAMAIIVDEKGWSVDTWLDPNQPEGVALAAYLLHLEKEND